MDIGTVIVGVVALAATMSLVFWRRPVFAAAQRSAAYIREVRGEVKKVTWPSVEELKKSTVVIVIFVIIIGLIIGLMDWLFSILLISFVGRLFG